MARKLTLTWLGHGGWSLDTGSHKILLDPFVSQSPTAPCGVDDLDADFILVSHGHFDHISDVPAIARRTGAQVISNFEIAQWLAKQHGIENHIGMNIGGGVEVPFGHVKMTIAFHSSQLPDGQYGGEPGGFLLSVDGREIYFACDTALFSDMQLLRSDQLDLAVLPIGDLFTMGPHDSVQALKLLQPRHVLPAHYNTWPPIAQDAHAWADLVRQQTDVEPHVLQPGEFFTW